MTALKSYLGYLDELGETCTLLDAAQIREVTGTDYYQGGIHLPGCLVIQPAAYIRGIAAGLSGNVAIHENSPVVRIECDNGIRAFTPKGTVHAEKLILTVNGHLESFGLYTRRLMHVALFGSMTRELSRAESTALGGENEWGVTPAQSMGSTVRRLKEGRIVVRNHIAWSPSQTPTDAQYRRAARRNDLSFRNRFPMLKNVTMAHRWGGMICLSQNSVPVFGEVAKGVHAACCQNGLGVARGTLAGILIADHVPGMGNDMVDSFLHSDMPSKLYPEPFMSIGARTRLWWGQKRAGDV